MTETSPTIAGQVSAIIVILRELVARLPERERDEIETSVSARIASLSDLDETAQAAVAAAEKTVNAIFIAPSPKSDG